MGVVVLLHGGLGQPGHPNAVAAHPQGLFRAAFRGESGPKGFGVLPAQLEDVPHLNAPGGFEGLGGVVAAAIARLGRSQIHRLWAGHQFVPSRSHQVGVNLIRPADKALEGRGRGIGEPQELAAPLACTLQSCIA